MTLAEALRLTHEPTPPPLPVEEAPEPIAEAYVQEPEAPALVRMEIHLRPDQIDRVMQAIQSSAHAVMTLSEAARYLRISPAKLKRLAEMGQIPGIALENCWRFPKTTLDDWLNGQSADSRMKEQAHA